MDHDNIILPQTILSVCVPLGTIDNETQIARTVYYTTQEYSKHIPVSCLPEAVQEIGGACATYLLNGVFAA